MLAVCICLTNVTGSVFELSNIFQGKIKAHQILMLAYSDQSTDVHGIISKILSMGA